MADGRTWATGANERGNARARTQDCPTCGAKAGTKCWTGRKQASTMVHAARWDAWHATPPDGDLEQKLRTMLDDGRIVDTDADEVRRFADFLAAAGPPVGAGGDPERRAQAYRDIYGRKP